MTKIKRISLFASIAALIAAAIGMVFVPPKCGETADHIPAGGVAP